MCQSTSTMRRRIFDAFFSNFFSRDFLSLILTRHRKNKKKMFNFSIYLKNYLLLRDKTKRHLLDENENLHLKLLACNDLFDESIIFLLFFFLFFFFFLLFFSSSRFSFSFSFFFFFSSREDSNSARSSNEYDSRHRCAFFFDEKAKIDRDVEAKTFEKASWNIINIFINVSFRRSLKNVDLQN